MAKALRPGPSNRGPFQGPVLHNDGSTGETTRAPLYVNGPTKRWAAVDAFPNIAIIAALTLIPHAPIDPPVAKKWAQQIDQPVNIAALTSIEPPKAIPAPIEPTYFWRRAPQIDVLPNIAVKFQTAITQQYPEPTLTKRLAPQIDLYPNVAVIRQSIQPGINGAAEQTFKRLSPQLDLYPNVAASIPAGTYQPPPAIDVQLAPKKWAQLDLFPNISFAQETVPVIRAPLYMAYKPVRGPVPDVFPNIAALAQPPVVLIPAPIDVPIFRRPPPQIDVYPNIVVKVSVEPGKSIPTLEWTLAPRKWTQPDAPTTNVAIQVQPAGYVPPPLVEPTYFKHVTQIDVFANVAVMLSPAVGNVSDFNSLPGKAWVQPDLFPNLAVSAAPPVVFPPPFVEPTYTKRLSPVPDVYPNIAATVPPPQPVLIEPIDPTLTKRVWAQVDVFQNQAIYAPRIAVQLPFPAEPTYTKRYWPQIDVLPNIAVNFNNIPAPPAPPLGSNAPTGGGGGGGKRDWPDHGYRHEEKPGKVLSLDQADAIVEAQTAAPQIVAKAPTPEVGARLVDALTVIDRAEQDDEEALILLLRGL
jgi:hypothetical protein